MEEQQTIKELQRIAKENCFYLGSVKAWNNAMNLIMELREDRDNLRKKRDKLKMIIKEIKNEHR